jgi:hypothetical protein
LMNNYSTKSNSCKMRERKRQRKRERENDFWKQNVITFSPVHDDIYMYYVEIFFNKKRL